MRFSSVAIFYWVGGFVADLALFLVLLIRGRWRHFPVFTLWIAFMLVRSSVLMYLYQHEAKHWYTIVYDTGLVLDFALQLGIVLEIAWILLRPTGSWVRDARLQFAAGGLAGIAVAGLFTWWITPPATSVRLMWQVRSNLFTSMVICELFVVMTMVANRLGLGWRNHVMAIGQGLTAWSTIMVVKTALESYLGTQHHYSQLEQVHSVTYLAAIFWITVQLWRDEPERKSISADLYQYILAVHRRGEYDLGRLDARH